MWRVQSETRRGKRELWREESDEKVSESGIKLEVKRREGGRTSSRLIVDFLFPSLDARRSTSRPSSSALIERRRESQDSSRGD